MAYVTQEMLQYYTEEIAQYFAAKTELPTATSDLTNDSNFAVDANYVHTDTNFTQAEKTKLGAIAEGAQVNVIETVKVNGAALTPDANKAVDILVEESTNNGKVKVNNVDVSIHGLDTAAYQPTTAFDAAGAASDVQAAITGNAETDTVNSLTLNGLKKKIEATSGDLSALGNAAAEDVAQSIADGGTGLTTSDQVYDAIQAAINTVDVTVAAGNGKALTGFEIADGQLVSNSVTTTDIGTAAAADVAASIAANSNDLATAGQVYTAIANATADLDITVPTVSNAALTGIVIEDGAYVSSTTTPLGTAAAADVATSIAQNGTGLATAGQVYSAIAALGSVMNYKGTKPDVASLPASGNETGDVWHVTATAGEYAWDGSAWQELGSTLDLSGYVQHSEAMTNAQVDAAINAALGTNYGA